MVGGTVIEVHKELGKYRLWCVDRHGNECAVYIAPFPYVKVWDSVWWQAGKVYWTPRGSNVRDVVAIKKIGNSFDPHGQGRLR
jgi:hypothetical protein